MKKPGIPQFNTARVGKGISRGRRRIFSAIMVFSPAILLVFLELILRAAHYGGDMSLFTKTMVRGKEYYSINRTVSRRYFTRTGFVPQLPEGMFEVNKGKKTKRIFCLGESTMAGFPYEFFATAPSFMLDRLKILLPEYNIEVVNIGLSAVGTFVVQDFMDELLSYEPDLFIVYVGHNEFYGVYGVGSSVTLPGGAWLTRLNIALLKSKTFLLMRDGYLWARSLFVESDRRPTESASWGPWWETRQSPCIANCMKRGGASMMTILHGLSIPHTPITSQSCSVLW